MLCESRFARDDSAVRRALSLSLLGMLDGRSGRDEEEAIFGNPCSRLALLAATRSDTCSRPRPGRECLNFLLIERVGDSGQASLQCAR